MLFRFARLWLWPWLGVDVDVDVDEDGGRMVVRVMLGEWKRIQEETAWVRGLDCFCLGGLGPRSLRGVLGYSSLS